MQKQIAVGVLLSAAILVVGCGRPGDGGPNLQETVALIQIEQAKLDKLEREYAQLVSYASESKSLAVVIEKTSYTGYYARDSFSYTPEKDRQAEIEAVKTAKDAAALAEKSVAEARKRTAAQAAIVAKWTARKDKLTGVAK